MYSPSNLLTQAAGEDASRREVAALTEASKFAPQSIIIGGRYQTELPAQTQQHMCLGGYLCTLVYFPSNLRTQAAGDDAPWREVVDLTVLEVEEAAEVAGVRQVCCPRPGHGKRAKRRVSSEPMEQVADH